METQSPQSRHNPGVSCSGADDWYAHAILILTFLLVIGRGLVEVYVSMKVTTWPWSPSYP